MTVETPSVLVRMSPELVAQLEQQGWEFGEPDADGFHTPTLHTSDTGRQEVPVSARDALGAVMGPGAEQWDARALAEELLDAGFVIRRVAPTTVGGSDR